MTVWRQARRWVSLGCGWLAGVFRRSLQLRIVALTILFTIIAIFGVGTYLSQQIARGLFEAKLSSVSAQTQGYVTEIQSLTGTAEAQEATDTLNTQLRSILQRSTLSLQSISLVPLDQSSDVPPIVVMNYGSEAANSSYFSDGLRAAVQNAGTNEQAYQSVALPPADRPGLVVAQKLSISGQGDFVLYVVAELQEEQDTLDFVQRALYVAALVLVILVGGVAWLMSRIVVSPVRTGAEVARKIADGDLDQRMPVNGEDEIASLAESFNDMADTLQEQIERMEKISVLQRQFVSDVSHELRTPLTTMHIASDMIFDARADFDETTKRSAELLNSQVERFELLLADLLEISRYDAGAAQLVAKPVDISEIVTGVIEGLSIVASQSATELVLHAPSAPVMAELDRVRVARILRNLVVNAIEHGAGRPIDLYVAANAEAAAVSVRDHGVGMTDEQIEHVFDRFWRADPARKRTLGGSGLGMAIALEDAHLHGGWLQVWAQPDEGACFRLTLPRRQGQSITSSPLPLPPADAKPGRTSLVAGPSTSDGTVRLHTGSIPIVVETEESQ